MGKERKSTKVKRVCEQCGKEFYVFPSIVKTGRGKFCSVACGTIYRNLHDNPSKKEEVRKKISENHADISGRNNPMYGKTGKSAPSYIDGRNSFQGERYKKILLASGVPEECVLCGSKIALNVHHIDGDRKNNDLTNIVFLCSNCHITKAHTYHRDSKGKITGSVLNKEVQENLKQIAKKVK
jgi:5-methylcytosine-specific restriction endonuclease McrA